MKRKSVYHLPLSSLQWLLTGLSLAAIPLWSQLPVVLVGFLGCLLWRFILERKGLKCPGLWTRCAVGVVGLLTIVGLHGTLFGLIAGMGVLLLLIALKVLEMRTEREFMLLSFLAFFILLTALFFSQTLLVCLYVCAVFLVLTSTIVQFTGGAGEGFRTWPLLRFTGAMVLQALPLIVLLFIFLPRMRGGGLLQISKPTGAQSGMSDEVNPGSFAELAQNDEIAFRADFPDGVLPSHDRLYWRVTVFTQCNGLRWRADKRQREVMNVPKLTGPIVVQRISMEPHTGSWVYGLDRPLKSTGPVSLTSGNVLTMSVPISERLNVTVTSQMGNDRTPLSDRAKVFLRAVPDDVGPRTRQLVESWLQKTKNPRELVGLARTMFRTENFRYTLQPGTYSANGLDEFLFERKLGFCEHYSAAFATLMRLANLPTRMVAGYHGGERNGFGDYLIVRQADAHAWTEIWFEDEGWVRFDPGDFINPLRVDADTPLASRLPTQADSAIERESRGRGKGLLNDLLHQAGLGWDTVNFQWNLHVVSYDQAAQRDFYRVMGIRNIFSWKLLSILLGGVLVVLLCVWLVIRQSPVKKDRSLGLYRELCRLLERHGLERRASEGPRDFSKRAVLFFPDASGELEAVFDAMIALRYGGPAETSLFARVEREIRQLRQVLRRKAGSTIRR